MKLKTMREKLELIKERVNQINDKSEKQARKLDEKIWKKEGRNRYRRLDR